MNIYKLFTEATMYLFELFIDYLAFPGKYLLPSALHSICLNNFRDETFGHVAFLPSANPLTCAHLQVLVQ